MSWALGGASGGGGAGFFTDGTGLNAGVGKGVVAPLAAATNSLAQGNASAVAATATNSIAFGDTCTSAGQNQVALGSAISIAAGYTNGDYPAFAQGSGITISYPFTGSLLVQGKAISIAAGSVDLFVQGSTNTIHAGTSFVQGNSNTLTSSARCFVQGGGTTLTSCNDSFFQGATGNVYGAQSGFFQGSGVALNGATTSRYCLLQGGAISSTAGDMRQIFAQGDLLSLEPGFQVFLQGKSLSAGASGSENVFLQGLSISLPGVNARSLFQGGTFTTPAGATFTDCLVQGGSHTFDALPVLRSFVQGNGHAITGNVTSSVVLGEGHTIAGGADGSFLAGYGHTLTAGTARAFLLGANNTGDGLDACAFGYNNSASGNESLAQGRGTSTTRNQQRSFSADRVTLGAAQTSFLARFLSTANATQATLLSLDLEEDKAYSIHVNLVVRNSTTDDECASFVLLQSIAYRDTGGAAVLQGSPVALTRLDTGGGSANLLAELDTSGNDVRLRVTGEAGATYQWCADFAFVEVSG